MSDQTKYRDEEWLRVAYKQVGMTVTEIAEECDCDHSTICRWLDNHGIETRSGGGGDASYDQLTDRDWLRKQYKSKERSARDIARECGCAEQTVYRWLHNHNIKTRPQRPKVSDRRYTDAEWLREQYVDEKRSQSDIAAECGCTASTVSNWLDKHDIETRSGHAGGLAYPDLADCQWLRQQYIEQGKTQAEIAKELACAQKTVADWLNRHSIETRDSGGYVALFGEDNPNYNGGPTGYGPEWNHRKKQAVRKRDGYTCQDPTCSVTQADHREKYAEKLHVHHLRKARDVEDAGDRNDPENLITLCRDCHRRWEKIADAGLVPQIQKEHSHYD